ncbi:MAG: GNAT family N-acetyltransferase, partial [Lactobacillaceae bacterium]
MHFSIEGIAPFDKKQKICEFQKLYLAPEAQGLGISKQLMETALSFAKTYYDTCYLETNH